MKRTERVLAILNVLAWLAFVGLAIEGGGDLVSWCVSIGNPTATAHLYKGKDLSLLRQYSFMHYTLVFLSMAALAIVEAYIAYLVIKVLSKIKMSSPFTMEIALKLERISYFICGCWVLVVFRNWYLEWLLDRVPRLPLQTDSEEFVFIALVVFVMAQIFKKGVELQTENELTV